MLFQSLIKAMPKVELHVHLEGSIRPETFLKLAERHGIRLPADDLTGLRHWYAFTDFYHFIEVYQKISQSLKTPEDINLIAREFLQGQADQNVRYCEVIYTPYNQFQASRIPFNEQMDALNQARSWAQDNLGVECQFILDISRETTPAEGMIVAEWAASKLGQGVCALGLGGPEVGNPPEKFKDVFAFAHEVGLPAVPHAGETEGPDSIWGALEYLYPVRIEHGVRCLEDPRLVETLRKHAIPLDVCPTSNICLKVFPSMQGHPLRALMDEGLTLTLNSDDPPLFNTTLTGEYLAAVDVLGLNLSELQGLVMNGIRSALLPGDRKAELLGEFQREFALLEEKNLD